MPAAYHSGNRKKQYYAGKTVILFSNQPFSFPFFVGSNIKKLRDRRSNILDAYVFKLFSGLKIVPLDNYRYGRILGKSVPRILS